jgi:hypothetical protein
MEILLLRILERIIGVVIGGLSIYFGYRLFLAVKATGEGTAEVKLPGDVTVMLSRIGPGVFFALFGTAVVGASLVFPVRYRETEKADGTIVKREKEISGVGEERRLDPGNGRRPVLGTSPVPTEELEAERLRVRGHIDFLNQLPRLLDPALAKDQRQKQQVSKDILAAKLSLIKSVWGSDWGEFNDFQMWAEGGAPARDSEAFRKAEQFFASGQEKSQ